MIEYLNDVIPPTDEEQVFLDRIDAPDDSDELFEVDEDDDDWEQTNVAKLFESL